jgi:hypothetical protein
MERVFGTAELQEGFNRFNEVPAETSGLRF